MKIFLIFFLVAFVFPVFASDSRAKIEIEVNEERDEFRVIVSSEKTIRFDSDQLEAPYDGFPPGGAGVIAMQESGEVVGCHHDNRPNYPALLGSQSRSTRSGRMVVVERGRSYVTPWYPSQALFSFFDQCVSRSIHKNIVAGYAKYQIHVGILTSRGTLSTKTGWLAFHGFKTSGNVGRRPQIIFPDRDADEMR